LGTLVAISFIYDGTFLRAWDFVCQVNPELKPILPLPTSENLSLILEQIVTPPVGAFAAFSGVDIYRRVYSTSVASPASVH